MYSIALTLQYLGIIAALVGIIFVLPRRMSKRKQILILILMSVLINQIGYLFELQATAMDVALVSIKVAYVGKMIAELFILIFVFEYTNYRIPVWLQGTLGLLHAYIIYLVWTCEKNTLYYSSISYTQEGMYPHVVLGHGVVYDIFTVVTISYMAIIVVVCVVNFIKANTHAQRVRMVCLTTPPITFVIGLFIFRSGFAQGYDTTTISYLISAIVFVYTIVKYDLVDEVEIVKDMMLDEFSEAVIVLDENGKIFYVNHQFEEIYPNHLKNAEYYKQIAYYGETGEELAVDDKYYRVIAKEIRQEENLVGVMYVLHNITEEHKHIDLINNYNRNLQYDVEMKTKSIIEMQNQFVLGMADMVEGRDANTGGHIKRTSYVVKILIDTMQKDPKLSLDEVFCDCVVRAAPMHDLGKIAVDDAILRKPGKFEPKEYEQMKTHAAKGAEIVRHLLEPIDDRYLAQIAENVAHYHHERVDGTGYPEHLKGDDIPFEARIMAVADVYDALVSKRCYKDSMSFDEAYSIIIDGMGSQFDKRLEPYFVACREELETYYKGLMVSELDSTKG